MSQPLSSIPLVSSMAMTVRESTLSGRIVTKTPPLKETAWEKICHVFREIINWFKEIFEKKEVKIEKPVEPVPTPDLAYLKSGDSSYNLKRLSEISVLNARESISTEEILKSVPQTNPYQLGYTDPSEYQAYRADRFIAAQAALTALAIIGISRTPILSCAGMEGGKDAQRAYVNCVRMAAQIWKNIPGQTFLAGSAILLGATLYAHRKGWLGALLHDRSLNWRQQQTETLFRDAADKLALQSTASPQEAQKLAGQILENSELIEATLQFELQFSSKKAKEIAKILNKACREVIDHDQSSAAIPTQEMQKP